MTDKSRSSVFETMNALTSQHQKAVARQGRLADHFRTLKHVPFNLQELAYGLSNSL